MLTLGIIAIVTSVVTELITWLNKKLTGFPPLRGMGAFIVVALLSFVGGGIKLFLFDGVEVTTWTDLIAISSQIFAFAQVYFTVIASKLGLTVDHERTE